MVTDAGARMIITEQQFLANVLEARKELPDLEHVIVIDGEAPEGVLSRSTRSSPPRTPTSTPRRRWRRSGPQDLLTIIYTSGTTGPPKGVQLSHRNLLAAVAQAEELIDFPPDGRVISWLPSRARRRAQRPPLPADRLRAADHLLRQPARDPRLPARGAARRGSSPSRASGRSSRPASRRWSPASPTSSARRRRPPCADAIEKVRLEQRGRGGPGRPRRARRGGRPRDLRGPARDARASTRSRRSTSARRRRRSRCSSSSTPSACRWPSCGG